MVENTAVTPAKAYGYGPVLAAVRFVPGSTPTIQEAWGVKSVARNGGAGLYRVTLADRVPRFVALVSAQDDGTTLYNFTRIEALSVANGTIDISHRSVAFASIADGPTASDSVDSITVLIYALAQ